MLVTLDESVPRGDLLKYLRFRAAFLLSEVFHSTVRIGTRGRSPWSSPTEMCNTSGFSSQRMSKFIKLYRVGTVSTKTMLCSIHIFAVLRARKFRLLTSVISCDFPAAACSRLHFGEEKLCGFAAKLHSIATAREPKLTRFSRRGSFPVIATLP
jgi:hypothetical protein